MYIYLYDSFLKDRKHAAAISAYENRLTDFGIFGKIVRITTFTNPERIIEDEARRGAKTVVMVGNNDTFARVISRAAHINLTYGFLPLGENNTVAELLGIPVSTECCDVLAKRRIEELDVGRCNDRFFFRRIAIEGETVQLVCEDKYAVASQGRGSEVEICNLGVPGWMDHATPDVLRPQDGKFTLFVRPSKKTMFGSKFMKPTVLQVKKIAATFPRPTVVSIDGIKSRERDIQIKVSRQKVRMIVGKDRKF